MDDIEKKLNQQKADVMKTECPIVIAGETSSGKSSIINLILDEEILPTGITSCTSRVCRVKHGEQFVISTKDNNDEELEELSFENLNKMAKQMEILAKTDDEKIRYVDVYMPAPLLQGNVMIVDTPGCGDMGQKEVSDMMMSYLPNALAFVFVLNVSNAGGIQDDRLLQIISKVRDSMDEMVSFNPKDVIFLLNKWETIAHVKENNRDEYFEKTKTCIRTSWKETDDSYIFQISAVKREKKNIPKYLRSFKRLSKM
ncbi:bacterial dynamin-like protein [Magallana gigas]|uniref:bacterial dynamin-like protein n=1 Tax=Magallana gigas TaxID=29159 RepID=UPI00333E7A7F